jgi:hypothetical protein
MKEGDKIYVAISNNKYNELLWQKKSYNKQYDKSYNKQYYDAISKYDGLTGVVIIRTFLWENYYDVIGFYEYEDMKILSKDEQMIKDIIE